MASVFGLGWVGTSVFFLSLLYSLLFIHLLPFIAFIGLCTEHACFGQYYLLAPIMAIWPLYYSSEPSFAVHLQLPGAWSYMEWNEILVGSMVYGPHSPCPCRLSLLPRSSTRLLLHAWIVFVCTCRAKGIFTSMTECNFLRLVELL